ncbi:TetR/AcrR family transcriptional regulator [Oxalobacteraceae bacterium]|nr:TetR/AcrR family transcriptional regulator [Oxalobacteraceae bacterium]
MSSTEKRLSAPEKAAARRAQVLAAAAECFSRSGFHGASMAEISKAAGMSAGHIYNYFDGKDAIIEAFVAANVERVSAIMRDLAQHKDPVQAMIDNAEETVVEHLQPNFYVMPLEIAAEASRNPKIAQALQAADISSRTQFRVLVQRARELHQLPVDDDTLDLCVETMIAFFHGLPMRALHHPNLNQAALVKGMRIAMRAIMLG